MAKATPNSDSPTVFVLDSDSISRNVVSDLARAMRLRCQTFVSGREFLEAFDPSRAGCLVTEVRTPEIGGLEVQRRLAVRQVPLAVVFLSAHATVPVIVRAMRMGATDFLAKPAKEHDLWEAIQEAVEEDHRRREVIVRENEAQQLISSLERQELVMLELLGQGFAMREVADNQGISVRTAEIRRSRLMQKLNVENRVDLLRFAFNVLENGSHAKEVRSAQGFFGSRGIHRRRSFAIP